MTVNTYSLKKEILLTKPDPQIHIHIILFFKYNQIVTYIINITKFF